MRNLYDLMTVAVPEGELDGMRVERFEIIPNARLAKMSVEGRAPEPGTYTRLMDDDKLWMSDTGPEKADHLAPLKMASGTQAERIILNGLGLGMVLSALLTFEHVQHIDVVERDDRVIRLVGPHYTKDPRVHIHHADAYEQAKKWPSGTRWDVGWSDVWGDCSIDDLESMTALNRSYGRRCTWHACWSQDLLKARKNQGRKHLF